MKKLFFSAIALVAFSGVSMGNTIAVEEPVEVVKNYEVEPDLCLADKFEMYNLAIRMGETQETARAMSWEIYWFCVKRTTTNSESIN